MKLCFHSINFNDLYEFDKQEVFFFFWSKEKYAVTFKNFVFSKSAKRAKKIKEKKTMGGPSHCQCEWMGGFGGDENKLIKRLKAAYFIAWWAQKLVLILIFLASKEERVKSEHKVFEIMEQNHQSKVMLGWQRARITTCESPSIMQF